jgi:putative acetyltransferase
MAQPPRTIRSRSCRNGALCTVQTVKRFQANPDNEIRLIAEQDGEIVGFGALVPENNKLRACYVAPRAAHGYEARERGEHTLRSGRRMACVKMRKLLHP